MLLDQGLIQDFFFFFFLGGGGGGGGEKIVRTTCLLNVRSVLGAYYLYYNFVLAILEALKAPSFLK